MYSSLSGFTIDHPGINDQSSYSLPPNSINNPHQPSAIYNQSQPQSLSHSHQVQALHPSLLTLGNHTSHTSLLQSHSYGLSAAGSSGSTSINQMGTSSAYPHGDVQLVKESSVPGVGGPFGEGWNGSTDWFDQFTS